MAPELLKREKYTEVIYDNQTIDMFGVAIITYVLFTGQHPFVEISAEGKKKVNHFRHLTCDWVLPELDSRFSNMAQDFVQRCGMESSYQRFTAQLALHHPFISKRDCEVEQLPPIFPIQIIESNTRILRSVLKKMA